jgi:Uma2 family endonuclease
MAAPKIDRMTLDAFLAWEPEDEGRYELVDGQPVAMTGARRRHDGVVVNSLIAIGSRLRGKPCRPHTDDVGVLAPNGNLRRPDVLVDCGRFDPDSMLADRPTLVIEVLSRSTREIDTVRKMMEYKSIPSMRYILYLDPESRISLLHRREDSGHWSELTYMTPDVDLDFPVLGITLPLAELYPPDMPAEA